MFLWLCSLTIFTLFPPDFCSPRPPFILLITRSLSPPAPVLRLPRSALTSVGGAGGGGWDSSNSAVCDNHVIKICSSPLGWSQVM